MLWLALHLPALSLEAYCALLPADQALQPVALLAVQGGAQRLSAVNAAAAQRGLQPGQRRATALALVPELLLGQASPERDAAALLAVAHAALAFTPMVTLVAAVTPVTPVTVSGAASGAAPGSPSRAEAAPLRVDPARATVLLEVQASLRLFGGLAALLQRLDAALAPLGHRVQRAAAPTPGAAALLARWRPSAQTVAAVLKPLQPLKLPSRPPQAAARAVVPGAAEADPALAATVPGPPAIPPATPPVIPPADPLLHGPHLQHAPVLAALLGAAPLGLLDSVQRHLDTLQGMGLHTLAELAALPRSGLARRFGAPLLDELDRLHGRCPDRRVPLQLPPAFDSTLELQARADSSDQVLAGAQVLLGRLLAWAQGRQVRLCAFELRMLHERHRGAALPATVLRVELAEPSLDPAHLHLLLRERLGRCTLAAPTLNLALHCHQVEAGAPPNAELFPSRQGADEGLMQLLERLRARLGDAAVHRLLPLADHRPERAQCQLPARGVVQPPPALPGSAPLDTRVLPAHLPLSRPAWLLAEPLPLRVAVHERLPRYQGRPLKLLSGPERIETGWWDGQPVARDYYIAADEDGSLLWIWRERLPVAADPGAPGVSGVSAGGAAASRPWFLHGRFA